MRLDALEVRTEQDWYLSAWKAEFSKRFTRSLRTVSAGNFLTELGVRHLIGELHLEKTTNTTFETKSGSETGLEFVAVILSLSARIIGLCHYT